MSSIRVLAILFGTIAGVSVSARAPVPVEVRTYAFKARIVNNRGISPLEQDAVVTGRFTYDLRGDVVEQSKGSVRYRSKRNAIAIECGDLRFVGSSVEVVIKSTGDTEELAIQATDFSLPKGWEMDPTDRQPLLELRLSKEPLKKARSASVPAKLSLSDFDGVTAVSLSFGKSISYPGGRVDRKPSVLATLERLEEVK